MNLPVDSMAVDRTPVGLPSLQTHQVAPPPPIRKPYRALDAWRGLAALLIVLHHASSSIMIHEPNVMFDPVHLFCWYAYVGVQLFFVMSGYCIANAADMTLIRGQSVTAYAWARAYRIYPTYWIAVAVWIGMNPFFQFLLHHHIVPTSTAATPIHFSIGFWLSNLSLFGGFFGSWPVVGQGWTLCYELSFYTFVGIALVFARLTGGGSRSLLWPLHGLTLAVLGISLAWPKWLPFPLDLYPHFGLGVLVYDWLIHRRRWVAAVLTVSILVMLLHAAVFNFDLGANPYPSRVINVAAAAFALVLIGLARFDERLSRTWLIRSFAIVGGFSYSLYLMHFYVVGAESQVLLRKAFFLKHDYLTLVITTTVALFSCWAFYIVGERPFLKRRRFTRRDLPEAVGVLPPSDASTMPATLPRIIPSLPRSSNGMH